MGASSDNGIDNTGDDTPAQHSSKLSLGSSPSVLSGDEDEDDDDDVLDDQPGFDGETTQDQEKQDDYYGGDMAGQDVLTTDKEDDMDDLFDGPLLPSTGDLDQDSASPLSSVPDDFPLSRSVSPELPDPVDPLLLLATSSTVEIPPASANQPQPSVSSSASTASGSPSTSPPPPPPPTNGLKRNLSSLVDESNDDDRTDTMFDNNSTAHSIKSRRLSMTGRDIYSRSSMATIGDDTIEEKEEEEDDDEGDTHDVDTSNDQTQPINNGKSPSKNSPPPDQAPISPPPQDSGISDQGPRDTDDDEQDTMLAPTVSHVDDSIVINNPSTLYEPSTSEEDHDNQQRHKEALEALTHIEVEFARLRDKMYQEKMAELNDEAIMIANGTHPELVTLMTEIEEKKGRRIRTAEAWRKYQHANFEQQFEGFEYQANVHFISRKSSIRRELLASTNGKRWRLEDEQGKLNDPLQKPGKLLPDAHTLRMQKQRKREETMDLQQIKDVIGFPRAPQVPNLSSQDIRDDLLLLGLGPSRPHSHS